MDTESTTLTVTLRGIRPILFDRYAGDNKTKLDPKEMFYLNADKECCIPILNVFSLLSAQNTPSVAKRFYGKQARDMALGIQAFTNIESTDPEDIGMAPICNDKGEVYTPKSKSIQILQHVARLDKGIPNPKTRPMIPTGWVVKLRADVQPNEFVSGPTFKKMIEQGGVLGLGTFRPIFGRYVAEWT